MVSSDGLNVDINNNKVIRIRLKNGTSESFATFYFATNAEGWFSEQKKIDFQIVPNDTNYTEYVVNLSSNPYFTGTLVRLRFDPNVNGATGNFSIDYIRICAS